LKSEFTNHIAEEIWEGRYKALRSITEEVENHPRLKNAIEVDFKKLQDAVYVTYKKHLTEAKEHFNLQILDRHKVASLSTIVIFNADCIKIIDKSRENDAYCLFARHAHSVLLGLSRIGDPNELYESNIEYVASVYSQLTYEEATTKSLACTYAQMEDKVISLRPKIIHS
jgi:hypothetical protein